MIDPISVAALITGSLGISAKDVALKVGQYLKTASEDDFRQKRASVRHHMLVEALRSYYGSSVSEDPSSGFQFYEVEIDGRTRIGTSVVAKPEWVGLDVDLSSVHCTLLIAICGIW